MTLNELIGQHPASIITILTALAFLWLALYVFRVNPEDSVSKLASGAMATIFFYLLNDFMASTATSLSRVMLYHHLLWWLPFAPVFWLHLSQKATAPLEFRGVIRGWIGKLINALRSNSALGALYGCAALFFLAGTFTDSIFNLSAIREFDLPLKDKNIPAGQGYFMFAAFVFSISSFALINFLSQWWQGSKAKIGEVTFFWRGISELIYSGIPFSKSPHRSQFWWLSLGSALFWLASAGLLFAGATELRLSPISGNRLLGIGVIIVALAILKYNALLKKEALERDVVYVSIGALAVAIVYVASVILSHGKALDVPVATVAVIASLSLSTHMLADTLKIWFSQAIGTRLGLLTVSEVDKMKQLYHEASRVKRAQGPVVEIFNDENKTVGQLLQLLTPRQREIITLRAKGLSDKQIADSLDIKLPTVRKHIEDIKNRIGSRDKADCAVYCIVTGLLTKEDLVDWFDSLKINGNDD